MTQRDAATNHAKPWGRGVGRAYLASGRGVFIVLARRRLLTLVRPQVGLFPIYGEAHGPALVLAVPAAAFVPWAKGGGE